MKPSFEDRPPVRGFGSISSSPGITRVRLTRRIVRGSAAAARAWPCGDRSLDGLFVYATDRPCRSAPHTLQLMIYSNSNFPTVPLGILTTSEEVTQELAAWLECGAQIPRRPFRKWGNALFHFCLSFQSLLCLFLCVSKRG